MATSKEFFNALDNAKPINYSDLTERQLYVENLRGDNDAAGLLAREVDFREGQGVYLFTGQIGSGKSTEMQRLKSKLNDAGCSVFYSDLEQWLNPEQPIELGSFLLAVVASWIEQTASLQGTRSPAQRIQEFLTRTKISLGSLTAGADFGVIKTNLQLALTQDTSVIEQVEQTLKANKTSFIAQVHDFVQSLVAEFPEGRKIVLLIDSLEKFRKEKTEAGKTYDSVLALFQNTHALKLPLVHVVYSISYLVYEQNRQLPAQLGGAFAVNLPSVHVFKHHSTTPDPEGFEGMKTLLTKRFPAWTDFFDETQIQSVVEKTGGDLRDFMRVLQVAIISHRDNATQRLVESDLEVAFNQIRPSLAIDAQHIAWMMRLESSHSAELEGAIDFNVLNRYLTTKHVLAYLNGQTWYSLHPLIRQEVAAMNQRILDRAAGGAQAQL